MSSTGSRRGKTLLERDRPGCMEDVYRKVHHLRRGGLSVAEVADRLGIAPRRVYEYQRRYMDWVVRDAQPDSREEVLYMEIDRLDTIQAAWWDRAIGEVYDVDGTKLPPDKDAASIVMKVITARAKFNGLDDPYANNTPVQQLLIVGGDAAEFRRALLEGRQAIEGSQADNGVIEGEVEEE